MAAPRATRKPTPASIDVFDLDAARAQRYEAGKPDAFTFRLGGALFHMPLDLRSSTLRVLRKIDDDDLEAIFMAILGDSQADRFFAKDPTLRDLAELMEHYQEAMGASLPKSSESPSS